MSKIEKLIQRFQTYPLPKDIDFDDYIKYAEYYGFRIVRTNGSHNVFANEEGVEITVSSVNGRKVKTYFLNNLNIIIGKRC